MDTGNTFTFSAVGFTSPTFWTDAAFHIIALGQTGNGVHVWSLTDPDAKKPPSTGNLSDTSVFVKFAKPITKTLSIGFMLAYELSQATLVPDAGGAPIQFKTSYLPSGGFGLHWHPGNSPSDHWQVGARVIMNHDNETRTQGTTSTEGFLRSYEYRLGVAYSPIKGTLFDVGVAVLDRSNTLEHRMTFGKAAPAVHPTIGVEQALVPKRVWARAGLDAFDGLLDVNETTWTTGVSLALGVFKLDLAYLYNLGAARTYNDTADVFGKRNTSLIGTLNFDYERALRNK